MKKRIIAIERNENENYYYNNQTNGKEIYVKNNIYIRTIEKEVFRWK